MEKKKKLSLEGLLERGYTVRTKEKNGVVRITATKPPGGQIPLPLQWQETTPDKS